MTQKGVKALEKLRKKLEDAPRATADSEKRWPPYALMAWDDRNRYHDFVLKLIDETIEQET